jgi:hypothetical protein
VVLDALTLVEILSGTVRGRVIVTPITDPSLDLPGPHLSDIEVTQALRRYLRDGELDAATAGCAGEPVRPRSGAKLPRAIAEEGPPAPSQPLRP